MTEKIVTFKTTAIRTDEYEIQIDENIWNAEALADYSKVFSPIDSIQELAEHLAFSLLRFGSDHGFIEGFGYVKMYRKNNSPIKHFRSGGEVPETEYAKGISAKILSEDDDYDFEITFPPDNQRLSGYLNIEKNRRKP